MTLEQLFSQLPTTSELEFSLCKTKDGFQCYAYIPKEAEEHAEDDLSFTADTPKEAVQAMLDYLKEQTEDAVLFF